jgi:hypothetical protein
MQERTKFHKVITMHRMGYICLHQSIKIRLAIGSLKCTTLFCDTQITDNQIVYIQITDRHIVCIQITDRKM